MDRKLEHYTGYRVARRSLVVEGSDTEIAIPLPELAGIIQTLSKQYLEQDAPEDLGVVPRPRRQPLTPDKIGQILRG